MSKKYEEDLDKTLIEISEEEIEKDETEDIIPFVEEFEEKDDKGSLSDEIKNIYDQMRSRFISVLKKRLS